MRLCICDRACLCAICASACAFVRLCVCAYAVCKLRLHLRLHLRAHLRQSTCENRHAAIDVTCDNRHATTDSDKPRVTRDNRHTSFKCRQPAYAINLTFKLQVVRFFLRYLRFRSNMLLKQNVRGKNSAENPHFRAYFFTVEKR